MEGPRPVEDGELEGLFGLLRGRQIALAVSGGADSTALMVLLARWLARAKGGDKPAAPLVLTVDHRLRSEAHGEALAVGRAAAALGFSHEILVWRGAKPKSGLQEAARIARYRLMAEALENRRGLAGLPRALVLAHTLDDQAETFMMRLARGSGVDGLAGMRALDVIDVGQGNRVALCRPLLGVPKSRLVATLEADGIRWSEDPSNAVDLFERVRVRKVLAELAPLGIDARAIGRSAARIGRAEKALSAVASNLSVEAIDWHGGAYATVDLGRVEATRGAAEELLVRVLVVAISVMGGESPAPQLSQLERLAGQIAGSMTGRKAKRTSLGGCLIEADSGGVRIFREAGRKGLPRLEIAPGECRRWDGRFLVRTDGALSGPVVIEALGASRWAGIKSARPEVRMLALPARAAATLPCFTLQGRIYVGSLEAGGEKLAKLFETLANPLVSIVFEPAAGWRGDGNIHHWRR